MKIKILFTLKSKILTVVLLTAFIVSGFSPGSTTGTVKAENSQKESPGIKTVDLAYLNAADKTIVNDGTSNYILASMQMDKGSTIELSDDENRTIVYINKLN